MKITVLKDQMKIISDRKDFVSVTRTHSGDGVDDLSAVDGR